MNMNWDEILKEQESDPGFAPVPEGKYPVRVEKAEATKASTGADMIKTQFVIVGGPHDGKKVFTNIVFSYNNPTAMRFTLRKLKALGVTREYLAANNPSTDQIASMIVGATCEAEVTIREYEGEKSNDVKSLKDLGEPGGTPAPPITDSATVPPVPTVPPAPTIPEPPTPAAPAGAEPADNEEPF